MKELTLDDIKHRRAMVKCVDYIPMRKHYRCQHYVDGGACGREDRFMCEEWEKRNPGKAPPPPAAPAVSANTVARSMKDALLPMDTGPVALPDRGRSSRAHGDVYDLTSLVKKTEQGRVLLERPELLTEHAVELLSRQGYEVAVTTEDGAEVTLVPAFTGADRAELTYALARTLVMILTVFKGATIKSLRKPDKEEAS